MLFPKNNEKINCNYFSLDELTTHLSCQYLKVTLFRGSNVLCYLHNLTTQQHY